MKAVVEQFVVKTEFKMARGKGSREGEGGMTGHQSREFQSLICEKGTLSACK